MNDHQAPRRSASVRVNPSGHREVVVKQKGKRDDETLNELARELMGMLESIDLAPLPSGGGAGSPEQPNYMRHFNQPDTPLMVGATGDIERSVGESPNNMTASTPQMVSGPGVPPTKMNTTTNPLGSDLSNKYITGSLSGIDDGATQSECFTGTAGIAFAPVALGEKPKRKKRRTATEDHLESNMTRKTINEWEPSFKAAGYTPGDYQMPSPTGTGVAARKPTQDKVGAYDTDTSASGKEWPRDHKDTAAMCDVDEDGVEHKPQGSHESTHGEPTDGHTKKVGHDWPAEAENDGSGVAEPFEGDRWSDGGVLKGQAPDGLEYSNRDVGMPSDGPITGTSGPQLGQPSESRWTPENVGTMMEGEFDVQSLFDNYARHANFVCVEDFQQLCDAHGAAVELDRKSLLRLMQNNQEFMFREGQDASGAFWLVAEEWEKPWLKDKDGEGKDGKKSKKDGDEDDEEGDDKGKPPFAEGRNSRRTINEFQIRSPAAEASLYTHDQPGQHPDLYGGDPHLGMDSGYEDNLADLHGGAGAGVGGEDGSIADGCPECGFMGVGPGEDSCPECGSPMGDQMGPAGMGPVGVAAGMGGMGGGAGHGIGQHNHLDLPGRSDDHQPPSHEMEESRAIVVGPAMMQSLKSFMQSARGIVEKRQSFRREAIGEALQWAWLHHAGDVDPRRAPSDVQESLKKLMSQYRNFNPLREDHRMEQSGDSITGRTKATVSEDLPDMPGPDKIEDHGDPLGKHQTNNLEGTPAVPGTAKGMSGTGGYAQSVKENVNRIANHVRKSLVEARRPLSGDCNLAFTILVREGTQINRTARRGTLAEALADVEELLQIHKPQDVVLESYFIQGSKCVLKHDIPMVKVRQRGPLVAEGKALFRFQRTAERFANELVAEGATCRITPHNWGHAVAAKVNYKIATAAFQRLPLCEALQD
jgi:hypothetical protein